MVVASLGSIGLASGEVCTIDQDGVAAVVSRVPSDRIRPERRNLAAHAAVLKALGDCTTVLPMSFGTIAASEQSIRDTLRRNQELFLVQLKRVAGRIEMGLRVEWDVPNVFEYFVTHNAELRAEVASLSAAVAECERKHSRAQAAMASAGIVLDA